jgi:hypothetical protein
VDVLGDGVGQGILARLIGLNQCARVCSKHDTPDFSDSGEHLPRDMSYAYFKLSVTKPGCRSRGTGIYPGLCGTGWVLAPNAPQPSL